MGVRVGLLHLLQRRLVVERGELLGQPLQDVTYGNRKFHLIMMIRLVREGRELEVERGIRGATCCSSLIVIVPPLFASHLGVCDKTGFMYCFLGRVLVPASRTLLHLDHSRAQLRKVLGNKAKASSSATTP